MIQPSLGFPHTLELEKNRPPSTSCSTHLGLAGTRKMSAKSENWRLVVFSCCRVILEQVTPVKLQYGANIHISQGARAAKGVSQPRSNLLALNCCGTDTRVVERVVVYSWKRLSLLGVRLSTATLLLIVRGVLIDSRPRVSSIEGVWRMRLLPRAPTTRNRQAIVGHKIFEARNASSEANLTDPSVLELSYVVDNVQQQLVEASKRNVVYGHTLP